MVSSRKYMISSALTTAVLLVALLFALFAMNPSLGWFSDAETATATGMQVKSKVSGVEAQIIKVTLVHTDGTNEDIPLSGGLFNVNGFVPGDKLVFDIKVTNNSDDSVNLSVYLMGNKDEKPHISSEGDEYLWLSTQLFISRASCTIESSSENDVDSQGTAIVPDDGTGRAYLYPISGYNPKVDAIPTGTKTGKSGYHYCENPLHEGVILASESSCQLSYTIGFVNSEIDQEEFKSDHFNGSAGQQAGYFSAYFEVDYSDKD